MFFGCVRQSSGTDDHPSPNQFLYIYRLMSVKSLIKSPMRASVQTDPSRILLAVQQSAHPVTTSAVKTIEAKLRSLMHDNSTAVSDEELADLVYTYCNECVANDNIVDDILFTQDNVDLMMDCVDVTPEQVDCNNNDNVMMTCDSDYYIDVFQVFLYRHVSISMHVIACYRLFLCF